jgi:hypothetical protein
MPDAAANAQSGANPGAIAVHTPCVFNEMHWRNCAIMAQSPSQTHANEPGKVGNRPDNTR